MRLGEVRRSRNPQELAREARLVVVDRDAERLHGLDDLDAERAHLEFRGLRSGSGRTTRSGHWYADREKKQLKQPTKHRAR